MRGTREYNVFIHLNFVRIVSITVHMSRLVANHIPLSAMLLLLGIVIGLLYESASTSPRPLIKIPHYQIQHLLISPILLHSSFQIYHIQFFRQFGTVMIMAILGTLLNALLIGVTLW